MKKKLRVAAYCRVSTEKVDQANSLKSQIQYFNEYIKQNNDWELVEIYHDDGFSGTSTEKRLGFNRMISDAEKGEINLIITKEISRFARNTVDSLTYTRQLKALGIGVIFINDNIYTLDEDGELRLTIMASIAQEESRKTSERVKWGQKRRMEQGVVFGRDLLGYNVKDGELIINPDEVDVVKLIYHKFLNEGKGTHVIARELYEAGINPKRVKRWSNTVILRVLRNEKYVGDLIQKKTITTDYLTHTKKYNRGDEEVVSLSDHHEPIIDRDTWDKVQEELKRRSPSDEQKSKHSNRYWCSGKLICGECGASFVSRSKKLKGDSTYKAWRCFNAANHGTAKLDKFGKGIGCDNNSINDKVLLYCMSFILEHIKVNKEKIENDLIKNIKAIQSLKTKEVNEKKLEERKDKIQLDKVKVIQLLIDNKISNDDMELMNNQYNSEIEALNKRIDEAKNADKIKQTQVDNIYKYIDAIRRMLDFQQQNEDLYKEFLDKIIVYTNKVLEIKLKPLPFNIKMHYSTSGRLDTYKVSIDQIEW